MRPFLHLRNEASLYSAFYFYREDEFMHWMKIKTKVNLCEDEWRLELDSGLLLCVYEDEDFVCV